MRAMVLTRFGGPECLELQEIERPRPGPGEVLVRVIAAGTNPVDAKLRVDGRWANLSPPVVLGYDVAGIVEEAGPGVKGLQTGDAVYYTPEIFENSRGGYAEYNVAAASIVAKKPAKLSFVEAAAVPLAGGTAWEAIIRRLRIAPGETVLIQGAAGGVGSFSVQFAKAAGARVVATASTDNHDFLRRVGADVLIDYHKEDVVRAALADTEGRGVDAAFDIEGDQLVARCLPAIRPFGRVAAILPPAGDLTLLYQKNITLYGVFLTRETKRLDEMRPLLERGQVLPAVDKILPLEKVDEAHARLDSRHGRGKIVLQVQDVES
ncbi:MAG TPA: zinc-binding dehydrogenase [Terriglobales bacterium]|nr:zinc-binding dehydrogenase [Terriglobales bacterium]